MNSLRQHFTGVATKYLSGVDATPKSHQHEIDEMAAHNLRLVTPQDVGQTYTHEQQDWLLSLGQYAQLVRERIV